MNEMIATQPMSGLISVEQQRAVAEVQARMIIARANPRDPKRAMDLIANDCQRTGLASQAVYQYAKGGTDVQGPSIRLVEAVARRWGNIASGLKELSRESGYSECVAYAWDLESGYYDERQFQVKHWIDTKSGGRKIKDERELYELIANFGQRRKRAVLMTVIPGDIFDTAVEQCENTLRATADTSPEGVKKMLAAFNKYSISKEMIEARIQRRIEAITPAQIISLQKIHASIRDGMSDPKEWFEFSAKPVELPKYADDDFEKQIEKWTPIIESGRKTPEQIIAAVSSKYALTDDQKQRIMNLAGVTVDAEFEENDEEFYKEAGAEQ